MHLYLIRHADPDYAHDTLTPQGFKEARALARRMAAVGLTHLYSSPLPRALLTAQAVAHLSPVPIVQQGWLVEPDYLSVVQKGTATRYGTFSARMCGLGRRLRLRRRGIAFRRSTLPR